MTTEDKMLRVSEKSLRVAVWTIVITVFLALAGGAISITYGLGSYQKRIENTEHKVTEHEMRLSDIENRDARTQRTLDEIRINLKSFIEQNGGRYVTPE